jgi:hypothetical protein
MPKKSASVRQSSSRRVTAKKPITRPIEPDMSADQHVFALAQRLAAQSSIVKLHTAAVDLYVEEGNRLDHMRTVREEARRRHLAAGVDPGAFVFEDLEKFEHDPQAGLWSLTEHYAECGYLYGLAIGLQLARGGAR